QFGRTHGASARQAAPSSASATEPGTSNRAPANVQQHGARPLPPESGSVTAPSRPQVATHGNAAQEPARASAPRIPEHVTAPQPPERAGAPPAPERVTAPHAPARTSAPHAPAVPPIGRQAAPERQMPGQPASRLYQSRPVPPSHAISAPPAPSRHGGAPQRQSAPQHNQHRG